MKCVFKRRQCWIISAPSDTSNKDIGFHFVRAAWGQLTFCDLQQQHPAFVVVMPTNENQRSLELQQRDNVNINVPFRVSYQVFSPLSSNPASAVWTVSPHPRRHVSATCRKHIRVELSHVCLPAPLQLVNQHLRSCSVHLQRKTKSCKKRGEKVKSFKYAPAPLRQDWSSLQSR